MKSGDLVIRRPNDGTDEAGIGTVCLVGDARAVVEWSDGQRTEIPLPAPSDVEVAPVGSLRHRALRDAEALRREFAESPVSVLVTLLGEQGGTASIGELRRWTNELALAGGYDSAWWGNVRRELDTDPRLTKVRGGAQWKLLGLPADRLSQEHMPSLAVATAEHEGVEAVVKTEPHSSSAPESSMASLAAELDGTEERVVDPLEEQPPQDAVLPGDPAKEADDHRTDAREAFEDNLRLLSEERDQYKAALRRQEAAVQELRAERDRLRLWIADLQAECERSTEQADVLRQQVTDASSTLVEANRRAEALVEKVQRREEELRQVRQGGRAVSQSQLRQARMDGLRVLAAVLAEVADHVVHATDMDGSRAADALYRRALTQAAAAIVTDIGVAGEETGFDPVRHRFTTAGSAERVVVERPGFAWQSGTPQEVVLEPALVRVADQ
ncbi:hypothetical protein [Streptomyces sp. ISL-100]|uniref:hypothetical protein n=1 Tax=Streptomyces sp. ISL-100 TaxID=2819173 RepID=UPI001BE95BF3|nr:hypothetical protein [Streptomyces sp. ISL-100]MBT2398279.1 hypothetical protein [Streptomyces sp. ISL-100]